jgi:hypothetical protein
MTKKYEITWHNPQETVLMVNNLQDGTWDDVLASTLEAAAIIQQKSYPVILVHNRNNHKIDKFDLGSIKKILYDKLPPPPKNMKLVIVLSNTSTKWMVQVGVEIAEKVNFGRKLTYFVSTMEEVEQLIKKAGV